MKISKPVNRLWVVILFVMGLTAIFALSGFAAGRVASTQAEIAQDTHSPIAGHLAPVGGGTGHSEKRWLLRMAHSS